MPKKSIYEKVGIPEKYIKDAKEAVRDVCQQYREENIRLITESTEDNGYSKLKYGLTSVLISEDKKITYRTVGNKLGVYPLFFARKPWIEHLDTHVFQFKRHLKESLKKHGFTVGLERQGDRPSAKFINYERMAILARIMYPYACGMKKHVATKRAMRIFGARIWKELDREVIDLTIRISYYSATSLDYIIIAHNKKEVKKLMQTTPAVVALWLRIKSSEFHQTVANFINHPSVGIEVIPLDCLDKFLRYNSYKSPNIVQETQEYLKVAGYGSKRIWKFLTKLPVYWAYTLFYAKENRSSASSLWVLAVLAEVGELPKYTTFKRFVKGSEWYRHHANRTHRDMMWTPDSYFREEYDVPPEWREIQTPYNNRIWSQPDRLYDVDEKDRDKLILFFVLGLKQVIRIISNSMKNSLDLLGIG